MGGGSSKEEDPIPQPSPCHTNQDQKTKTTPEVNQRVVEVEGVGVGVGVGRKNGEEIKTTQPLEKENTVKLPHNFDAILKDADSTIRKNSKDKLLNELQDGKRILLNQNTRKYWIDKKNNNCFLLYARDILITWGEDIRYWRWLKQRETSDELIDVAELLNVCWLEMHAKFDTKMLSPGVLYEIVFVIMIKESGNGWYIPVKVILTLPDGTKQQNKVNLSENPREKWMEITVGEFKTSNGQLGEIDISMYEIEGGHWKRGLVVKGIEIRPKN